MDTIDLNEILVFTRVVEAQGFTAAARRLGLPKSTVSRKVAQLEKRLGVPLLVRTTRRLHLTEAGSAYYARCSRVVAELDEAERAVRDLRATPKGTLRITAPVDFALLHMGDLIAEYTRKFPEVNIVLSLSSRLVDMVGEGFDLAVRGGQLADSSLIARKVGDGTLGLFASAAYLKKHGRPRTLSELSAHACVIFGREPRAIWKLKCGQKAQELAVSGRICSDDFGFVLRALLADAGIGLLPRFLAAEDLRAKRLVALFDDYRFEGGGLYLVYPSARHMSSAARSFIDFATQRLSAALATPAAR